MHARAHTHTHTHTHTPQQVLTGSRPHSQNTDMQIGKLQTERRRWWNEERKEQEEEEENKEREGDGKGMMGG